MKYFSLFSGVEGFGLGIPNGEPIGFSEIDKYASMVLRYRFPKVKNYGDCRTIDWKQIPNFDLLTGGSPCQDFSIAGKRKGLQGARSSLAWEFVRALRDKKPKYFLWENVKGVISSRSGWDFANILTAFSESGYALWWQVLNAKDFGVPQNRERIFVLGFRERHPKKVFFEREDSKEIKIVGATIGEENTRIGERDSVYSIGGIMGALKETDYNQPLQILYDPYNQVIPKDQEATTTLRTNHANGNPQIIVKNKGESQHYRLYDEKGLAPALQSQSGMSSQKHPFIFASRGRNPRNPTSVEKDNYVFALDLYNKKTHSDRTPALTEPHHNSLRMNVNGRVRKLMPIECERLMSFPDDWTRWGTNEKGEKVEISDSQRYKMCGNGVVSNVIREIIKLIY